MATRIEIDAPEGLRSLDWIKPPTRPLTLPGLDPELQVWDGLGSDPISDDVLLHDRILPSHVLFDRPDSGSAVTLDAVDAASYQAVFTSDGMLSSGPGVICLNGGESFGSVAVYAAGGIEIFRWNGTGWASGF